MSRTKVSSARKRTHRAALARRDGARCAYCLTPFPDLTRATIDHVVPLSLYRTWAQEHTVLACTRCNQVKADRLPLTLALLLCAHTPAPAADLPDSRADRSAGGPADPTGDRPARESAGDLA
ncbi:HNH endonuclease, partial [Streptomyces sp. B1866]|uniref:HNH endonuclease n=1 Tax=Streptomyces sp. B1866 TaxID=3075431 RepID=UPI00289250E9